MYGVHVQLSYILDSQKDFIVQDITWMSSLGNTKWLSLVAQCLDAAIEVVNTIDKDRKTVVLREEDSRIFACLISSLSQIMMDSNFRSRAGFQSLIQREWVMMGYPFQKHLGLVAKNVENEVPLFLLFLDCVWQLIQQFPSEFGFSETYLTTLWDSVQMGIFDTFLFDSCYQRKRFFADGKCLRKCLLPSVWNWNFQFSQEEQHFFNNPLYLMKHNLQLNQGILDAVKECRQSFINLSLNELYVKKLGNLYEEENGKYSNTKLQCLIPITRAPVIKLWSQCYLRWQTPCQIVGGGNPSQYLQQCLLVEEVIHLEHKLQSLKQKQQVRPRSDLIFSLAVDTPTDQALLNSTYLTSSFPFTPGVTHKTQQQMMNMPISVYLQNSAIGYDYDNEDDD
ncbi:hypothetical protein KUTeg_018012 [Tegillarca granosa]|uniref:Myotubularin phosphatase domain-containing protein n=1 Tax=Tegillarca granosa TaxID=220873 RepID=A0ABQ9EGL0_TEGGR|nr:hypothetical protein KUTeg_018012 [Tegillarca granosa]